MYAARLGIVIAATILFAGAGYAQSSDDASAFLSKVNQNNDQTLSIRELNDYAAKKFVALNTTGHRSLSRKELAGRLSAVDFETANTTKGKADQSLSKHEFITYADRLFRDADTNHDSTLNLTELQSPAGQKLVNLLH